MRDLTNDLRHAMPLGCLQSSDAYPRDALFRAAQLDIGCGSGLQFSLVVQEGSERGARVLDRVYFKRRLCRVCGCEKPREFGCLLASAVSVVFDLLPCRR